MELPAKTFRVTRADLVRYAGASGDFNPIHWSDRVATKVGLPGVIAHGMFTMALVGRAVAALGQLRSKAAVPALMRLFNRQDLLLKELAMKKEILAALAAIADRSVTPPLLTILKSPIPAVGRWLELRCAVATALGMLGDETALPTLVRLAGGEGPLADASREALSAVDRVWEFEV